jgi:multiple sugar transport system substrate-binding protein
MSTSSNPYSRRQVLQLGAMIGAGIAAGPLLASCAADATSTAASPGSSGGAPSGTIRFSFWGSDDRVKKFQSACDLFHQKNPAITVNPEFGAIDAIKTKLTVAMAGGNLPDVFWVIGDLLPQMVSGKHILDLGPYLGNGISTDGFSDSIMTGAQYDGKQYTMTHGLQSIGLFADKNVLDALGVEVKKYPDAYSWDEYAELCAKIHAAKGDDFFGTDDPNYAGALGFFRAYARQNGEDMFSAKGDLGFTKGTLTDWLNYWEKLRGNGSVVPTSLALEQNPYFEGAPMIRGLSAFHLRNSNQLSDLQVLTKDTITLMPAPGNGGDGNSSIAIDPNLVGISANSANRDAAVLFVDFLLNDPDRAKLIGTTIGAPPTQKIRDLVSPSLTPPEAEFLEYASFEASAKSKPVPIAPPTAGAFQTEMGRLIEELAYGRASVDDTVSQIMGEARDKLTAKS